MLLLRSLASLCVLAAVAFAVPAQEKRIHHHADLSDHAHDDAHGFQYDHEAFLGKEEAKTFDQLTPEESKARLAYVLLALSMFFINCPLLQVTVLKKLQQVFFVMYFVSQTFV